MITYLQFIEELKELKDKPQWKNHPAIDGMIAKYEKIVDEHEQQENA